MLALPTGSTFLCGEVRSSSQLSGHLLLHPPALAIDFSDMAQVPCPLSPFTEFLMLAKGQPHVNPLHVKLAC